MSASREQKLPAAQIVKHLATPKIGRYITEKIHFVLEIENVGLSIKILPKSATTG